MASVAAARRATWLGLRLRLGLGLRLRLRLGLGLGLRLRLRLGLGLGLRRGVRPGRRIAGQTPDPSSAGGRR